MSGQELVPGARRMTTPYPIPLSEDQERLLNEYAELLLSVNQRFNLISRSDIDQVRRHHIGHCLAYAIHSFPDGCSVVDWGSGGGLPAIPIAILWPGIQVTAVDSNGNKTRAVDLFCRRLGLNNCNSWHGRAGDWMGGADYSVSRATASLSELWEWHARVKQNESGSGDQEWESGLICLKGGDLSKEIAELKAVHPHLQTQTRPLSMHDGDPYFSSKVILHVTQSGS